MITVIAHDRSRPESVATVRDLLARHSRVTRAEDGCRQFDAHQDADDPTRFALIEVYDSPDAFDTHRASEHFRTNIERTLVPLVTEREWHTYGEPL